MEKSRNPGHVQKNITKIRSSSHPDGNGAAGRPLASEYMNGWVRFDLFFLNLYVKNQHCFYCILIPSDFFSKSPTFLVGWYPSNRCFFISRVAKRAPWVQGRSPLTKRIRKFHVEICSFWRDFCFMLFSIPQNSDVKQVVFVNHWRRWRLLPVPQNHWSTNMSGESSWDTQLDLDLDLLQTWKGQHGISEELWQFGWFETCFMFLGVHLRLILMSSFPQVNTWQSACHFPILSSAPYIILYPSQIPGLPHGLLRTLILPGQWVRCARETIGK